MDLSQLERFRLAPTEADSFRETFSRLITDANLNVLDRADLERYLPAETPGCYFWMMRSGNALYKIYLGRTQSIFKRISDYANDFQIHAPNDYKLRFFQAYMENNFPGSVLDLYFTRVRLDMCRERETELVRRYKPLINERLPATREERNLIRTAFEQYYESTIERKLTRDA